MVGQVEVLVGQVNFRVNLPRLKDVLHPVSLHLHCDIVQLIIH